jgi:hypothetical protein
VLRAQEIRRLRAERRSINEIHAQLASSSRVRPANLSSPATADAPPEPHEVGYPCTRWEVVQLRAGLVLLVDLAGGAAVRSLAAQLYRHCAAVE